MKKESQCQIRSHHKCLSMLQLQIISFDNVIIWLHYNLIIFIWWSHTCWKAPGKWNWKGHATAQSPLGLVTMQLAPSKKTAHSYSACSSKLTAICCGSVNLCGNTRSSKELQSSQWRYANYETGNNEKMRGWPTPAAPSSAQSKLLCRVQRATSREVGNNCWKTIYILEKCDC